MQPYLTRHGFGQHPCPRVDRRKTFFLAFHPNCALPPVYANYAVLWLVPFPAYWLRPVLGQRSNGRMAWVRWAGVLHAPPMDSSLGVVLSSKACCCPHRDERQAVRTECRFALELCNTFASAKDGYCADNGSGRFRLHLNGFMSFSAGSKSARDAGAGNIEQESSRKTPPE